MKKIIILLFTILCYGPLANAQVSFAARAGAAYSSMVQRVEGLYKSGGRFGYSFGVSADVPFAKRFSFRPEIAFVNQGGSYLSDFHVEGARNSRTECNYYALQVPLNVVYTFQWEDIRLGIFAGPVADFSLFGKMDSELQNADIHFGKGDDADLRMFDLGIDLGLQVEYSNYFFSIAVLCGTIDRRVGKHEGESSVFQNNVTFSLGYIFR